LGKHSSFTDVRSERLSWLLRSTVEKTLAGLGNELKEYAIVLEVYDLQSLHRRGSLILGALGLPTGAGWQTVAGFQKLSGRNT
jgi:hypothetical protein